MLNDIVLTTYFKALFAFRNFKDEERGAVDIVAIVVMIGIAVVLAIAFKGAITKVLNKLMGDIGNAANNATQAVNF